MCRHVAPTDRGALAPRVHRCHVRGFVHAGQDQQTVLLVCAASIHTPYPLFIPSHRTLHPSSHPPSHIPHHIHHRISLITSTITFLLLSLSLPFPFPFHFLYS